MSPDSLVRAWVRLYTAGMSPEPKESRRAEIESDLWEHRRSARSDRRHSLATSFVILGRWLAGIVSDLSWRFSYLRTDRESEDSTMTKLLGRSWWQEMAALVAVASAYFGIRQYLTSEVSVGVTVGKVLALFLFLGCGLLVAAGLVVTRTNPRRGAGMVVIGVAPVALIGGLGLGTIVGLVASALGAIGWWWVPVALASSVATVAGIGAFGTWWNATRSRSVPRISLPAHVAVLLVVGLGTAAAGVGLGLTLLSLAGLAILVAALTLWGWRVRSI